MFSMFKEPVLNVFNVKGATFQKGARFQLHCELNDRVLSIGEEVTVLSINLFQTHLFCYNWKT